MFRRTESLQELCLIAVVRDIDVFIENRNIPERLVEFLFRAYSKEILKKHNEIKNFMDDRTLLWFLNCFLHKVRIPAKLHSGNISRRLTEIGSGITSLNLQSTGFAANELNELVSSLPNVVYINLNDTLCDDKTLACLKKSCRNLKFLNVSNCLNITDVGMARLCRSRLSLKKLNLLGTKVSGYAIVQILKRIRSLESLKCCDLPEILYDFFINKRTKLTELQYDRNQSVNEENIKAVSKICPKLKKLHFEGPVEDDVLKVCSQLMNLDELAVKFPEWHLFLDFVNSTQHDVLTPILPLSSNLKTLILSCVHISVLSLVECFKNLENLYLNKVSFAPFKMEGVKCTKTNLLTLVIEEIEMKNNDANYNAICLLISLSNNVKKLHLKPVHEIPSTIFNEISKSMKTLEYAKFDCTYININSLMPIFDMASMNTIISDVGFEEDDFAKETSCTLDWRYIPYELSDDDIYYYDDTSDTCHSVDCDDDTSDDNYSMTSDTSDFVDEDFDDFDELLFSALDVMDY